MKINKLYILPLIALGFFAAGITKLNAQETARSFTVVPPTSEHALVPGGKAEGVMKVINDSDNPLTFQVNVHDFVVDNNQGQPNLLPDNTLSKKYSAASWLGVVPSTFTVLPHKRQDINFYLQVPADARPGGHYAAVVFTPTTMVGVEGTGTSVQTKIGTLFYVTVEGKASVYSRLTKFLTNFFQEYGPVTVSTQIRNLGDIHVKPSGFITVSDTLGRVIAREKLEERNIFPMAARDFESTFGQKYMFGRYKASIDARYGNAGTLVASTYFWVLPWKIMSAVVLALAAIVLAFVYRSRKTKEQAEKKE